MTREEFITYLSSGKHLNILYSYHQEHGTHKPPLSPMEFTQVVDYFKHQTLPAKDEFEAFMGGEPAIDMNGVVQKIIQHYHQKFSITTITNKEGQIINYI